MPRRGGSWRLRAGLLTFVNHVGLEVITSVRSLIRAAMIQATPPMALSAAYGEFFEPLGSDPAINLLLCDPCGRANGAPAVSDGASSLESGSL